MTPEDPSFWEAVEELRELALRGAELSELLEFAKARAGKGNTVLAIALFYRAFDLPLRDAISLGGWVGFQVDFGNSGMTAEELETEYGELVRTAVRRLVSRRES